MSAAQDFLGGELAQINDENIRKFTEYVLDNAPAYFWTVPSSSTSKYHPYQSNGIGGLVRHTRSIVYFSGILCRAYSLEGVDKDVVTSACILHDLLKYGLMMQKYTTKTHSTEGANFVHSLSKKYAGEIDKDIVVRICSAIAWHMGQWEVKAAAKKFPEQYNTAELIVHLADMVSAGKEVSLGFLQENLIG